MKRFLLVCAIGLAIGCAGMLVAPHYRWQALLIGVAGCALVGIATAVSRKLEQSLDGDFIYTALDAGGREIKAAITAGSKDEAIAQIKEMGYFPTTLKKIKKTT